MQTTKEGGKEKVYLHLMNEKEKELFIGLAYGLASADGDYSDEEKVLIDGYCKEMQITFDEKGMVRPAADIIDEMAEKSDGQIKKIIVFELIGLAMVDGNYEGSERTIINQIEEKFQMDTGFADKCEKVISDYIAFQSKINQLVLG